MDVPPLAALCSTFGSYSAPKRLRMNVPPCGRRDVLHRHSRCPRLRHSCARSGETVWLWRSNPIRPRSASAWSSRRTGGAVFYVRVLLGPEAPPHGCAASGGAVFYIATRGVLGSAIPARGVAKPRSWRVARLAADLSNGTTQQTPNGGRPVCCVRLVAEPLAGEHCWLLERGFLGLDRAPAGW